MAQPTSFHHTVPGLQTPLGGGYQVGFAEAIRKQEAIATGAVGMITEPTQADAILKEGKADLIIVARELLRDPTGPAAPPKPSAPIGG